MRFDNKKGQFLNNILIMVLMVVVFFILFGAVDGTIDGVKQFAPDSASLFLIQSMSALVLIGIIRFVYNLGRGGSTP